MANLNDTTMEEEYLSDEVIILLYFLKFNCRFSKSFSGIRFPECFKCRGKPSIHSYDNPK